MLRNSPATDRDTWSRTCGLLILGFVCYALPWRVFAALPVPVDNTPALQIQGSNTIGAKLGPALFKREESRFFHPENVAKAEAFFAKHGSKTIVLARFVPIVRTFITAVAGIGRMDFKRYLIFSAIGGLLWAVGVTLAGYWLGNIEFVKKNIEIILIAVVLLSVIPIVIEFIRHRRGQRAA